MVIILHLARRIKDLNIQATDGELGKVKDIYFDEDTWIVRYLVASTQKWLPGRKVLISPIAFDHVDLENFTVNILETKESIKDSPSIDEDEPVSREKEASISAYYGWPYYWGGGNLWGAYPTPPELLRSGAPEVTSERGTQGDGEHDNKLRSTNEIQGDFTGYNIQARDGEIGHVSDFIVDDTNWRIRYFIVETKNILPGEFITVSTDWINAISWSDGKVHVDLTKDEIENGPTFNPDRPFTREDEDKLYESYGKVKYYE